MSKNAFSHFSLIVDCIREAMLSRQYVYSLSEIKLAHIKEETLLKYCLIGTGKESDYINLLSVYNDDEMLLKFKPHDIKVISTTAILIKNSPEKYKLAYMQLKAENDDVSVSLENLSSSKRFKIKLSQLIDDLDLLDNLSGKDAFILGERYGEIRMQKAIREKVPK
jgi:hypothetical protein